MSLYTRFTAHLDAVLDALEADGVLPAGLNRKPVTVEPPRDPSHGDLATNAAMVLAKPAGTNPRALADAIVTRLTALDEVESAAIAGPGFINLTLTDATWRAELAAIHADAADYGRSDVGAGTTVNVEYVSANPTGPMHMGHCRGAVVGDALATLLEYAGHKVIREYYINDAGGQVDVLARSAHVRYREALGEDVGVLEAPKGELPDDWEPVELPLFRSTKFGDDQDRPIKKSNGAWTYFGADMAYHFQKAQSADQLIDIWGADHAGTVKRIQAAVAALTEGKARFDVKLIQMVRLLRDGEPVKMSKRAGNFVTLADVVQEVGKDVVRFTMLTRKADAQMDFDFAKVVEASKDNPVFYVQYAHARISSLGRRAQEAGIDLPAPDLSLLGTAELAMVKLAAQFPRVVEGSAQAREPHRVAFYLNDLASAFHGWWNMGNDDPRARVILADDPAITATRLFLAQGIGQIIRNGLALMGVAALTEMG